MVDWISVFDEVEREQPAAEENVSQLRAFLSSPLTIVERDEIAALDSELDPTAWGLPDCELPGDFKDFLRWSNGGGARTGEREFGFFDIAGIRDYMLRYLFPEYMPGVVPFAFNGGGIFYAFDVRSQPLKGEYPIVAAASGVLNFDDSPVVASTFMDLCRGTVNVGDILYPPTPEPSLPVRGDLWIVKSPNGLKELASVKKLLGLDMPLGELRAAMSAAPCRIARNVLCNRCDSLLAAEPELRSFLAVTEIDGETRIAWP